MDTEKLLESLNDYFLSYDNVVNFIEPANIVDGLYAIARAINNVAEVIEKKSFHVGDHHLEMLSGSLDKIAEALEGRNQQAEH